MNLIEKITRQAALLPREAQTEVLDFVDFLVEKYTPKSLSEEEAWDQASQHQLQQSQSGAGR